MELIADLHVHSKYARATSRDCNLEELALHAALKGVSIVATGDFTHPAWFRELKEKLVPAEPGLFRLRQDIEKAIAARSPLSKLQPARFILQVEVATISKRGDKIRKVHHCVYASSFESAERLRIRLAKIGNITADGRPVVGLDPRELLEIALECGDDVFLIPAHIWTPWFSALGASSGFDSIQECYGDLAQYIFAVETGLSSDPPMNWMVSSLAPYRLVSSSDAHSPSRLGREATIFDCDLSYFAVRDALRTGDGYIGTIEFFPEEGKYHLDGHRNCGVRLEPKETIQNQGRCPRCGKEVTIGVMHRVLELADQPAGFRPHTAGLFFRLIPLTELLAEIFECQASSKKVVSAYMRLISRLGPELNILMKQDLTAIELSEVPLLAEAINRMRKGKVFRQPGYDGQYGVIRVFDPFEIERLKNKVYANVGLELDLAKDFAKEEKRRNADTEEASGPADTSNEPFRAETPLACFSETNNTGDLPYNANLPKSTDWLDDAQRQVVCAQDRVKIVIAGPGSGKTRLLASWLAHQIQNGLAMPQHCLALTFTRRAVREIYERVEVLIGEDAKKITCNTIHGFCFSIVRTYGTKLGLRDELEIVPERILVDALRGSATFSKPKVAKLLRQLDKELTEGKIRPELPAELQAFFTTCVESGRLTYSMLIPLAVELLEQHLTIATQTAQRFRCVAIDEFQDLDPMQYRLIRRLFWAGNQVLIIGDPDQSIYGFRGASPQLLLKFQADLSEARVFELRTNYRSTRPILELALAIVRPVSLVPNRVLVATKTHGVKPIEVSLPNCTEEANWIVKEIVRLAGGLNLLQVEAQDISARFTFGQIGILVRTEALFGTIEQALKKVGIPYAKFRSSSIYEDPVVEELCRQAASIDGKFTTLERLQIAAERLIKGGFGRNLVEPSASLDPVAQIELILTLLNPIATEHTNDWQGFIRELTVTTESDLWERRGERVSLITIHASKGLEFEVVFIAGCEDRLIPFVLPGHEEPEDAAEERRLFFVGLTRAKSLLYCTWARERNIEGRRQKRSPSPFLRELPNSLIERVSIDRPHRLYQPELF